MRKSKHQIQMQDLKKQYRAPLAGTPHLSTDIREAGVSIIQFAFIFPILFMCLLVMIDLGRVLCAKAILTKGAENGLNLAMKIPNLDIDIREHGKNETEHIRFRTAREIVLEEAEALPLNTLFTPSNQGSSMTLISFSYKDKELGGGEVKSKYDAALLRPGEKVELYNEGSNKWFNHKTLPYSGAAAPNQRPEDVLKSHPIIVELRGKVTTFFPFFDEFTITGSAVGFREEIPRGPLTAFLEGPEPDGVPGAGTTTTTIPFGVAPTPTPGPLGLCVQNWAGCAFTNFNNKCVDPTGLPLPPDDNCPCVPCQEGENYGAVL